MKEEASDHSEYQEARRIAWLMARFIRQQLTEAQHNELDRWVEASRENQELFETLTRQRDLEAIQQWFRRTQRHTGRKEKLLRRIKRQAGLPPRIWHMRYAPLAAATLLLALCFAFLLVRRHPLSAIAQQPLRQPENPGRQQARLVLANGDTVWLGAGGTGLVAMQGNSRVNQADSSLYYQAQGMDTAAETRYNVLSTPVGSQFQLMLADGTRVWLNAASSLRYPVAFRGRQRRVQLQGEAYFEVAKKNEQPFLVAAGTTTVQVLGTHFNINAYADDGKIRTTLMEGSVQVQCRERTSLLHPGELARSNEAGIEVAPADTEEEIAWKNGLFVFRQASAASLLADISRWYGVEIVYQARPSGHFHAAIERSESLRHLLEVLEKTGNFHARLEDKKLIVQP